MKRSVLLTVAVSLTAILLVSPAANASESYNWVEGYIFLDEGDGELMEALSSAYAYVEDSDDEWDEDEWEDEFEAWVEAEIDNAYAYAWVEDDWMGLQLEVWPDTGMSAYAQGETFMGATFEVFDDGDVTFGFDFEIWSELITDNPGDWASAATEITIGIGIDDTFDFDEEDYWDIEDYVSDGEFCGDYWGDDPTYWDTLYITRYFEAGDVGSIGVWINSEVEAYTTDEELEEDGPPAHIPAPGAMLLAGLGTALTGYLRRRQAI
ncbi:MAG: hypothetical protein JW720_12010 [Sedimentisphaerales bacterium]|nr:hypothetical protein [Sedimentisphaerales bacterium]